MQKLTTKPFAISKVVQIVLLSTVRGIENFAKRQVPTLIMARPTSG